MKYSTKEYISFFEKTLNFSDICWWIIDFENNPDEYYCNNFMKKTFSLDMNSDWHSIEKTCPIAGDYNKNIELASKTDARAKIIIDEYHKLLKKDLDEYNNEFPYFSQEQSKTLYFSSRAKALEFNDDGEVTILYGVIQDVTELKEQQREIEKLINIDKLTGLYNRHKLDSELIKEVSKSTRYNTKLSIIILDIDNFKCINDSFGHLVGDNILKEFSNVLSKNIRSSDTLGRWGGEEFLIICPFTNLDEIKILANKIKEILESSNFCTKQSHTASFGVAEFDLNEDLEQLLTRADKALYKAKINGKNRVEY
jgi:diguanylate cyclase (GGDEF)-like protein